MSEKGDRYRNQAAEAIAARQSGSLSLARKMMHVALAVVPFAGWLVSFELALAMALGLVVASLAVEGARRWWPGVNRLLWRLLPTVFRMWEGRAVLGSTWYALGALVALVLFGRDAGGIAVLCLAWGDPAAEVAGRLWGRGERRKTVVGSLACFIACLLAAAVGMWLGDPPASAAVTGALVATATERWSPPPDDNLWIPILSGGAIAVVEKLVYLI